MQYNGEHLFPGQLGHFLTLLSLVASLVATFSYFKANRSEGLEKDSWIKFSRIVFLIETISVVGIFITLFYIISNHYHEYYYAWNHSSRSLQPKYLLASFWEGQEGSFMLWNLWHCVLGWVLIWRSRKWEAPVMTVVSFAQFCIATMLVGLYIFNARIGSNPFILFRDQMPDLPIFHNPDYLLLPKISEGNDLNSLLQNYWMVIHPPVLFLGFASTIIPFAFAFSGLMNKDNTWTKTALPWAVFSAAALGTGIMMGAAWAYESLSFGGYWAWDPVENASLVPWLTLIAGMHTNLVFNHSGYSLKSTYLFYIISFSLVLYSTFLTRSGVLGDTSVHAFTGADMNTQLLIFLGVFFVPAMVLLFARGKQMPVLKKEENTYSREFWMFIGSLVLFLSAILIIAKTSIPVYNKLFDTNVAMPEDPEFAHNKVQVFIAIIIGLLTAVTQYFKYKNTPKKTFLKNIWLPTLIALVLSVTISVFGDIDYVKKGFGFLAAIHVAIFAAVYGVVANSFYIWVGVKGKLAKAGPSVAHVGFALALAGILISSSKKEILSHNTTGIAVFKKDKNEDPAENITLFKGIETDMGKYHVTYVRDSVNGKDRKKYFELVFKEKSTGNTFNLYPDVLENNKGQEGFSANPDKKHYWNKDIFVYVSSWRGEEMDTASFKPAQMKMGDTIFYSNGMIVFTNTALNPAGYKKQSVGDTTLVLNLEITSKDGRKFTAMPAVSVKNNGLQSVPDSVIAQGLVFSFNRIVNEKDGLFEIGVKETGTLSSLLTLKVYQFPFINILWLGIILTVIGMIMSILQRTRINSHRSEPKQNAFRPGDSMRV